MRRLLLCFLLPTLLLPLSSEAETFRNPQVIATGSVPVTVMEGDLNGDGRLDLVYSDVSGFVSTLHVLLNQGNGQFQAGQSITGSISPFVAAELADVNSDGKLDLVMAFSDSLSSDLKVVLGNGDGTFQPPIVSTLPSYGAAQGLANIRILLVADLNADGKQDVIFSDIDGRQIWICLGDNAGHFTQTIELNDQNPAQRLFLGDFNQDGHIDVIGFENLAARAVVYLGNANGTFAPPAYYTSPNGLLSSLLVSDMDGDGDPDMVITSSDNVLRVLHGYSDGTFVPILALPIPVGANGMYPTLLDIEDYNHDGAPDIALESLDGVHILIGQGNFTFKPFQPAPLSALLGPGATGDLNQDANIDFTFPVPGGLAILYGNPDGSLRSADSYDVGYLVSAATVADFNGDGKPDIAVGVDALDPRILIGDGQGGFTLVPDTNTMSGQTSAGGALSAGDFNGDGLADLLSSYGYPFPGALRGVASALGRGDGTFGQPASLPGYDLPAAFGTVIGDINNDGRADVAATQAGFPQASFFLGQPDGSLLQKSTVQNSLSATAYWVYADFNKDGKLDAAVFDIGDLQVENGHGDGTFQAGFAYHAPGGPTLTSPPPSDAVVADLDGDGNLDIAAPSGLQVQVFYGHGDGTFDAPTYIPLATLPSLSGSQTSYTGINAADLNLDGLTDLVLTDGNEISILHGAGSRTYGPAVNYLAGADVNGTRIADFNHDGYPDILVANAGASTVTVLLNEPGQGAVLPLLTVNPEPSTYTQPFLIQLSLAAVAAGSGVPTGSAVFSIDGAALGTVGLVNGKADLTVTNAVSIGTHTISVIYGGDSVFQGATFSVQHIVVSGAVRTQIVLTAAPNPVTAGVPVLLTAAVTAASAVQGGSVAFMDGGAVLANATVGQGGVATFTTASLSLGTHALTAAYTGVSGFAPGTSNVVSLLVQGITTGSPPGGAPTSTSGDFALQVPPAAATVYTGATANLHVTVGASGGFAQDVSLACAGLPAESSCIFKPSLVSGGNGQAALTIQTTPPHAVTAANGAALPWQPLSIAGIASSLAWIILPRRVRLRKSLCCLLMLLGVTLMLSACGDPGPFTGGTPAGVYQVSITGTATQNGQIVAHSATMQLTVKAFR